MVSDERTALQLAELLLEIDRCSKQPELKDNKQELLRQQCHGQFLSRLWLGYQSWKTRLTDTMQQTSATIPVVEESTNQQGSPTIQNPVVSTVSARTNEQRPAKRLRRTRGGGNVAASASINRQVKAQETFQNLEQ
jgi:hypothetical protein